MQVLPLPWATQKHTAQSCHLLHCYFLRPIVNQPPLDGTLKCQHFLIGI